jgi:hypothetical protein
MLLESIFRRVLYCLPVRNEPATTAVALAPMLEGDIFTVFFFYFYFFTVPPANASLSSLRISDRVRLRPYDRTGIDRVFLDNCGMVKRTHAIHLSRAALTSGSGPFADANTGIVPARNRLVPTHTHHATSYRLLQLTRHGWYSLCDEANHKL